MEAGLKDRLMDWIKERAAPLVRFIAKCEEREDWKLLFSLIFASISIRTDISTAMKYAMEGSWLFMILTLFFLTAPCLSLGLFIRGKEDPISDVFLGTVYRYWLTIDAFIKAEASKKGDEAALLAAQTVSNSENGTSVNSLQEAEESQGADVAYRHGVQKAETSRRADNAHVYAVQRADVPTTNLNLRKAEESKNEDPATLYEKRAKELRQFLFYMSILKSAPQGVLQLCILCDTDDGNALAGLSAGFSLLISCASMASSDAAMQGDNAKSKTPLDELPDTLIIIAKALTVAARVSVLAMVAVIRDDTCFLIIRHNIVAMFCLVLMLKKKSVLQSRHSGWRDYFHSLLMAMSFLFCVSTVSDLSPSLIGPVYVASFALNCRMAFPYLIERATDAATQRAKVAGLFGLQAFQSAYSAMLVCLAWRYKCISSSHAICRQES